jgi:hypothetical protein
MNLRFTGADRGDIGGLSRNSKAAVRVRCNRENGCSSADTNARNSSSVKTATPNPFAFSSFDPAASLAKT